MFAMILEPLIIAMEAMLVFYLSFAGPLAALALLSLTIFILMLPLYRFGDVLLAREHQRKAAMQHELDSITHLDQGQHNQGGMRKYFYTREIYRRYGYNPIHSLVGLFGLAVQIPFFFASYQMLHNFASFTGLTVGPFQDLAQPDGLWQFYGISVHILPLFMTLLNLLSAYLYAANSSTNPSESAKLSERARIWLLPTLFLLLLYQQPVALVFYWSINNILSLLKNLWHWQQQKRSKLTTQQTSSKGAATNPAKLKVSLTTIAAQLYSNPSIRAFHISLLFLALFLATLYLIRIDEVLVVLWLNISLAVLVYLALYYGLAGACLVKQPLQGQNTNQARRSLYIGLSWLWLLALLGTSGLLLRLIYLGAQNSSLQSSGQLAQSFMLEKQAQALRPIAWGLGLLAVICGQILLPLANGYNAWLWPYGRPMAAWLVRPRAKHPPPLVRSSIAIYKALYGHLRLGRKAMPNRTHLYRYTMSITCMLLAIFGTVPAKAVASDPASFEGNSNYLTLSISLALLLLLASSIFLSIYLLFPKVLRYYSSLLATVAACFFSINVLWLPGDYGPLEFTSFRNPLSIGHNEIAASVLLFATLLCLLLSCYLSWYYQGETKPASLKTWLKLDHLLPLLLASHILSIVGSSYQVSRYHFELAQGNRTIQPPELTNSLGESNLQAESNTRVQLSLNGPNVIILVLDKFMAGFIPELLPIEEPKTASQDASKPVIKSPLLTELSQRFDGFVYYPNSVSQAQRTYGGLHPIVGGSEYTVDQMNANQRPLELDIIEAFTMIPKALNEQRSGFASYFINVEYVLPAQGRATMLARLATEQVQVRKTGYDYSLVAQPELTTGPRRPTDSKGQSHASTQLQWQNFLSLLGLFQAFGPIFREKIYNHGKWMGLLGNASVWASIAFWQPYIELLSLSKLFEANDELKGSYVLYHNQLTHNTASFTGSEQYFGNPENFHFPLPPIPAILQEIDRNHGSNHEHATAYLAHYQSLYLVANWLDTLKEQGLYDNSQIYLVSDHGSTLYDPSFPVQGRTGYRTKGNWHSLYMSKGFGERGSLQSSPEFRTVADIPAEFLPQLGIHKNPYSGKALQAVQTEPIPLFVIEGVKRSRELAGNGYQYYIRSQYNLHKRNIFHDDNWEAVP